jgi:hypothetical protein
MTDDDISSVAEQLQNLQLYRKETVIEKKKVVYPLPLPPSIAKVLEKRKKKRAERRARRSAELSATQDNNLNLVQVTSSQDNQDSTETQPQTQVESQVAAEPEEQVVPNLCDKLSRLIVGRKRSNLSERSSQGSSSNIDDSGSSGEETDDWGEEEDLDLSSTEEVSPYQPMNSWTTLMSSDPLSHEESSMTPKSMCLHLSQAFKDLNKDPIWTLPMESLSSKDLDTMEDALPLRDLVMDDRSLNEVLLMTLGDIGYKGPLPADFHEPLRFNYVPSLAPNPAAPVLEYLQEAFVNFEKEGTLPADAGIMDLGSNIRYEPNMWQEEEALPEPSTEPFPYFSVPQDSLLTNQYSDFHGVSTSGQYLISSGTLMPPTNMFEEHQILYQQSLDYSTTAFGYETEPGPFGTPYIVQSHTFFHQHPSITYSTPFEGMSTLQSPPIYASPQMDEIATPPPVDPPENKGWSKLLRSILKLIGKATKDKAETQSSIDPESMLQYLA